MTRRQVEIEERLAKLEKENADLNNQNENLRLLIKSKLNSTDSIPEEVLQSLPLKRASTIIDDRFKTVTITFKPEVDIPWNDTVAIMGEFNNWMPENMERYDSQTVLLQPDLANTFFYMSKLLAGFKYRYHFSVGDQFVVDTTKESSEDRFNKVTNFAEV